MVFDNFLNISPYSLDAAEKEKLLTERLVELTTRLHQSKCPEYNRILRAIGFDINTVEGYTDIPFLPVRLFKEVDLKSVLQDEIM